MINIYKIVISIFIFWALAISCTKENTDTEPLVRITEPDAQTVFLVPDTIDIFFSVEHELPIEYIRVSIDNKNMTSISNQYFIYPKTNMYNGGLSLYVDNIPSIIKVPPYYIHIAVSDYNKVSNTYLEIKLYNNDIDYKGYFVIGNNGVDESRVSYYNGVFQKEFDFEMSGIFIDSEISSNFNLVYIATTTPDKIRAYDAENGELRWTKDPQLPYPKFNKIVIHENILYSSTAIGRIIGLSANEGNQIFATHVLHDSIPINICVTDDYIISNFKLRNAGSEFWTSFYKPTGIKYQTYITGFETVNFYNSGNTNEIIALCNNNSTGKAIVFNVLTNIIENSILCDNFKITNTCKIDNNFYLVTSNRDIHILDIQNNSISQKYVGNETIIDIEYNHVNNQIFVAFADKVEILSYPQFSKINTTQVAYLIKSVELLYGYNK